MLVKQTFILVSILLFCNLLSWGQYRDNPEIISRNGSLINVKYTCNFCHGSKSWNQDNRKACPNCDYWTARQREYNVCSVCRNAGYIITKRFREYCSTCKGKGYFTGYVSQKFERIFSFNFKKMYELGSTDFILTKIIDKDNIVIDQSNYHGGSTLVLNSDNSLRMMFSDYNTEFVGKTIYHGTWQNYGNEDLIFKLRAQKAYGDKAFVDVIFCTQQNCSECHGLGAGFYHYF